MILSKANLVAVKVAAADKSDPALHQLHVEADGTTVASNGNAILAVEGLNEKPVSMPRFEVEGEIDDEGIGIQPEVVEEALRNMPKGNLRLELGFAAITIADTEKGVVELTTTDLVLEKKSKGKMAKRRFPMWRRVLRLAGRKERRKICVDRRALIRLLQAMDSACPDPEHSVFIEFGNEPTDGIILRGMSVETGQHAVGYVIPLDTMGKWLPLNQWERRVMARARRRVKE